MTKIDDRQFLQKQRRQELLNGVGLLSQRMMAESKQSNFGYGESDEVKNLQKQAYAAHDKIEQEMRVAVSQVEAPFRKSQTEARLDFDKKIQEAKQKVRQPDIQIPWESEKLFASMMRSWLLRRLEQGKDVFKETAKNLLFEFAKDYHAGWRPQL